MDFDADRPRPSRSSNGGSGREYILDMIDQLAAMARQSREHEVAIHLEAILAAAKLRDRRRD